MNDCFLKIYQSSWTWVHMYKIPYVCFIYDDTDFQLFYRINGTMWVKLQKMLGNLYFKLVAWYGNSYINCYGRGSSIQISLVLLQILDESCLNSIWVVAWIMFWQFLIGSFWNNECPIIVLNGIYVRIKGLTVLVRFINLILLILI